MQCMQIFYNVKSTLDSTLAGSVRSRCKLSQLSRQLTEAGRPAARFTPTAAAKCFLVTFTETLAVSSPSTGMLSSSVANCSWVQQQMKSHARARNTLEIPQNHLNPTRGSRLAALQLSMKEDSNCGRKMTSLLKKVEIVPRRVCFWYACCYATLKSELV